jgi:AraC-like DNA-binding protein
MNFGHESSLIRNRTVSAAFIETMLVVAEQLGVNKESLLHRNKLTEQMLEDPVKRIDEALMLLLFDQIVNESKQENFGLIMGQHSRPGTYSALGYAVMNCAHLGEAFHLIPRYEDVVMELGCTRIEVESTHFKLIWGTLNNIACPRALIDSIFSSWMFLAQWLCGKRIVPYRADFSYSEPGDQALHHQVFGGNIRFSCQQNALIFMDHRVLEEKILQADQVMNAMMKQRLAQLKDQLANQHATVRVITDILMQSLPLGRASLSDVAIRLNSSERTLRRRLKEEGHHYQQVLAQLRHTLACNYLKDPSLSILDITLLLGYAEQSSLTAAFKIWQGETPGAYRKRFI